MKISYRFLWIVFVLLAARTLSGETWYIRHDGGSRYSSASPKGQCDGKADAPYHGRGVNQHCAFNDYRYLWDDRSYGGSKKGWAINGGDTVIIRGGPWRVGWDANSGPGAGYTWCLGGDGNGNCTNPTIPAGTASQHTRILGENYEHCSAADKTDRSKLTEIYGGFGVGVALNLGGAKYVDVECLNIARHSQCIMFGDPAYPAGCNRSAPVDDYDSDGVHTDADTRDVLMQDMWIHGHPGRGVKGGIGGVVTCMRCDIAYNGGAGWDFDDGGGHPLGADAAWNFLYSTVEWSGCNQEYPIVHEFPAISCYGQSNGGYGDGVGTPANTGLNATIDHSTFAYNTQDGLDLGHVDSGSHTLKITNSIAYGNGGGAFKWGANFTTAVFTNNLVLANCMRMSAPMNGAPATYNKHLGDFCRALDAVPFDFRQNGTVFFANNTIVTYSPTTFDLACWDKNCSNSTLTFKNNIVLAYDNKGTYSLGGKEGGPGAFYFQSPIGRIVRSNNIYYGVRDIHRTNLSTNERILDPQFVGQPVRFTKEQDLDGFNFHTAQTSPARGTGATLPEVRIDYEGKPRPAGGGYDIGAMQH